MSNQLATATAILEALNVSRIFRTPRGPLPILHQVNLSLRPGEFVALRGRSGSGKTTLLNILGGLDDPTEGRVSVVGQPLESLGDRARAALRREQIGLLFQNAHLFPSLTARENIEIPLRLQHLNSKEREERSKEVLHLVGLSERAEHRSLELSGGEQQRVALARALVHRPRILLADEPTGNLDSQTSLKIMQLFRMVVQQTNIALLIATHDAAVYNQADRVITIQDGHLLYS
ncbi:ABC transporter ATP-binding protein [Tengunoibacter tsumagoiensis]|uniref:ABC transporter ATP-binding protein n=1 Tax=Tengunoibacter tsumagoiensis TaxID=2014871 RepID=A0A401ZWQ4_9CHLR|nr:ABC transporter ATP-binding protein [Tengunoibacter tsumagoiensis]GCE11242.1 ABC transporter ATP-binding protein [Tengunoibacter tsumagoiensis]